MPRTTRQLPCRIPAVTRVLALLVALSCAKLPNEVVPGSGGAAGAGGAALAGAGGGPGTGGALLGDAPSGIDQAGPGPADRPPADDGSTGDRAAVPSDGTLCRPTAPVRCEGNSLIICNDSGSGFNPPIPCQHGCDRHRLECNVCSPGVRSCNGPNLDTCMSDGSGFYRGTCNPVCLPTGGCCSDLECGRCGMVNPCRRCGATNQCEDSASEPSCATQGACTAEATEVCRMNGATCEVRKRIDSPCRYQLCRWAAVALSSCGQAGNRGIPTEACHPYSFNNPNSVPAGLDGACITQVENITGVPFSCL